ncbi:hypothetical protein [Campylobacter jejuni]|uniref:hypothetical protein n=1 Tax=Campylobacter jejuni TaxID=197 RepID=UPI000F80E488|nr:hypothetical protein [Campylobacter jejuni]RTK09325.1 hypothetical protein C3H38_03530 [Campylobacter jejuni]HEF7931705.1 hypothetical protein [Campylobacter jejuni]
MWRRIKAFRLKGFLKKRARKLIYFLSRNFDISVIEIKSPRLSNIIQAKETTSEDLFQLWKNILNLDKSYPVNTLKMKNIHVYPWIRKWLWLRYNLIFHSQRDDPIANLMDGVGEFFFPYNMKKMLKSKYSIKEIEEIDQNVDFIFFASYGSSENIEVQDKKIYQRLTDPIFEIVKEYGTSIKLCPIQHYLHCSRFSNLDFIFPLTFLTYSHIVKSGYSNELNFSNNFLQRLKKNNPDLNICINDINVMLDKGYFLVENYIQLFSKMKPKVIFMHSYSFYMPVICAAHFLKIPTVEIQHGEIGSANPVYGGFEYFMPNDGYESIPDYFFVWYNKHYHYIKKTFNGKKHKPILIGNPWIEKQKDFFREEINIKLKNLKKRYKKIAICLLSHVLSQKLSHIVSAFDDNTLIIVRHHPNISKKYVASDFNHPNVLIENFFDQCILGELFNIADYVISEGSTASLEAALFGVTSFVCTKEGLNNFKYEIDNKILYYVDNKIELEDCLKKNVKVGNIDDFSSLLNIKKNILEFLENEIGVVCKKC